MPDSLGRIVGKLIVGKVQGLELDGATTDALREGIMGGVTLFKENAADLAQLVSLVDSIHEACDDVPLVTVDQEGGAVQRFDHVLTPLPSAMALAAADDLETVRKIADLSAMQLRLIGVNCVLAPVLDVNSNPLNPIIGTRSFGSDPDKVKECGIAMAEAFKGRGMIAVGKHFPGHGDTLEDSHSRLAVNHSDAKALWRRELVPFRGCLNHLPAVLTAHMWLPAVDDEQIPASLSNKVTSGLLRHYLGFEGAVFTDDLLMKGVTGKWGLTEAALMAVEAGADRLLVCGEIGEIRAVHEAILAAVTDGRLHESTVRAAAARLSLPEELSGQKGRKQMARRLAVLTEAVAKGRELAFNASLRAVTALRGRSPAIIEGDWVVVAPDHPRYPLTLTAPLAQALAGVSGVTLSEVRYPLDPDQSTARKIARGLSGKSCVFLTYRTLLNEGQVKLGRELAVSAADRVTVSVDVPYDLVGLPNWDNCLATYDPSELAMEALAAVLAGRSEARGTCPVSLQFSL